MLVGRHFQRWHHCFVAVSYTHLCDTFLIAEIDGVVAGYIEGPVIAERYLTDDLFHKVAPNASQGGFIAVTSLSISKDFKGQGIGTALIAALKDLAIAQKRQGIILTFHDYLIAYYETVSYTHLDVYKRQHIANRQKQQAQLLQQ